MGYNIFEWLLFFFIYCFLGWCIESAIVTIDTKTPTNRGFLRGPALPIYGFGAILIIFCTLPVYGNYILEYLVGVVACTVLEYVTGVLMEAIFKTRYWDYTGQFMNFQGRICLRSSLFWGVLTLFVVHVIHEPIAAFVTEKLPLPLTAALASVLSAVMLADLYFSAKAAFMLDKLARALDEINVQMELAKMEARDAIAQKADELSSKVDERVEELRQRREEALQGLGLAMRSLARNNPTARHSRFAKSFEELKEYSRKKLA